MMARRWHGLLARDGKNAADVLAEWGYTPSLDSESAMLTGDVQWVGAPYQFKLAHAGQIQAHITNGHFLKSVITPQVGYGAY